MKSSLLSLALFCASLTAVAQTQKGDIFNTGSVSLGLLTNLASGVNQSKYTVFSPSANFTQTKFFRDNWAFRWGVEYGGVYSNFKFIGSNQESTNSAQSASLSGSWLYYYGQNRWRLFAGLGVGLSRSWATSKTNGGTSRDLQRTFTFAPEFTLGGLYFLNRHWALSAATSATSFPISTGSVSLGLTYAPKGNLTDNEQSQLNTLQKGGSVWGLGFSINSNDQPESQNNSMFRTTSRTRNASVSYGKLIGDRLVLGGTFAVNHVAAEYTRPNQFGSSSTVYALGAFLKKYHTTSRLTPYTGVSASYGWANTTRSNSQASADVGIITLNGEAGLAYLVSNHFLVEGSLANLTLSRTTSNGTTFFTTNLSGVLSPTLRVQYVFRE